MASIQHAGFSDAQNRNSLVFKALAHPARLAILDQLCEHGKIICKELELDLPLSQSSVSGHLKILLESGVLGYEKVGNVTYYVVNPIMLDGPINSVQKIVQYTYEHNYDFSRTFFKTLPNQVY